MKTPPPWSVRLSQILWVLSLIVGAGAIVYLFIIRQQQLPRIVELVRGVDGARAEETYTMAADIVFWTAFGILVAILLLEITFQVSFANRRPHVRWWQFGTLLFQAGVFLIVRQLVALGNEGQPLDRLLLVQLGFGVLGLLVGLLPPALRWTARRHDIRRGSVLPAGGEL